MATFRTLVRAVEVATLACLLVAVVMLGYHPSTHRAVPAASAAVGGSAQPVDGAKVYAENCTGCHGSNRSGGFAPALTAKNVTTRFPDPADERRVVANGRGGMPAWAGSLSAEEIDAVVAYTRR